MNNHQDKPLKTAHIPAMPLVIGLALLTLTGLTVSPPFYVDEANSDHWGMLSVTFMFLLGLSMFGVVFSSTMRIVFASWGRPFARLGEMLTLSFAPMAFLLFFLIIGNGRDHLLYWVTDSAEHSPWLSEAWLFWRNVISLAIFYAVSLAYYRSSVAADAEGATDTERNRARWRGGWVVVVFICTYTLLSWDLGMMAIPHFHSTVFPLHMILGNLNGGVAWLLLTYLVFRSQLDHAPSLSVVRLKDMAITLMAFTLLWLYMFWAQFFVIWFGNLPHETEPVWRQMYGHYSSIFWIQMACVFAIPFITLIFAWTKRSLWVMTTLSLVVVAGVWCNRYLMVLPVINEAHVPFADIIDIPLLLGPLATHWLLMMLWCWYNRRQVDLAVPTAGRAESLGVDS